MASDQLTSGDGDPNAVVTDPTGGAPNFNIQDVFEQFGYYPTQAEVNAMSSSFEGTYNGGQIGTSAVAQYVNFKQQEATREANDPLGALQTKMDDSVNQMKQQVQGLYGQLQDTLSAAPQLFGSLTPDQIQQYLAPLKTSFDQQMAQVQGIAASRGLGASSTEANALAQTNEQFQQQVFSTGLQVGQTAQTNKANAIQAQINNLFGLTGQEEGISANAAQTRSQQNLGQSNLMASLPYFLDQSAAQQQQIAQQQAQAGGFWNTFNKVTSGINTATGTAANLMGKQGLTGIFGGSDSSMAPKAASAPAAGSTPTVGAANFMGSNSAPGGTIFGSDVSKIQCQGR